MEFFFHVESLNYDITRDRGEEVLRNFDEVTFDSLAFKGMYEPLSL